ncbi:flagellar motor switch protein FliN [Pararhizobium haloflavum]|uniref:flagellar motor switch protein FliN n=1 Tax=Pararhizobium haloflavum TaxID=2037914 RepID=UPI0027BA6AC1|nr:flagellar motor switch protein FliN [Pararhizobium haloflavum]
MGANPNKAKLDTDDTAADDPLAAFEADGDPAVGDFGADFEDAPSALVLSDKDDAADDIDAHIPETKAGPTSTGAPNLDLIMDIPIDMQIVLGTSRLPVSGLMNLTEGSLIGLDRKIGEPVDIMVNGRLFGRGEITVLGEEDTRFGVKLIEVMGDVRK